MSHMTGSHMTHLAPSHQTSFEVKEAVTEFHTHCLGTASAQTPLRLPASERRLRVRPLPEGKYSRRGTHTGFREPRSTCLSGNTLKGGMETAPLLLWLLIQLWLNN